MKNSVRIFAYFIFALGMTVIFVLPSNKYSWMVEMDPSLATLPIDNSSGERAIFSFLLFIAIVGSQLVVVAIADSKREKVWSLVSVCMAIAGWSLHRWL